MRIPVLGLAAAVVLSVPAAHAQDRLEAAPLVAPFSAGKPGGPLPRGWTPFSLGGGKRPTEYKLVDDDGRTVLRASAEAAASALSYAVNFDIRAAPVVEWRWKVARLIDGADNSVAGKEDSPARWVFGFDGDRSKFSILERSSAALARTVTGRDLPYAEIIYIWSNKAPVGTVIPNPHTRRVQMVVASSGAAGVGKWQVLSRNLLEDFRRAFGEEPGMLTDVGVLTDTDNTGGSAEAWYGDIHFVSPR
ncbi:MAG TPA: DUF3047 domain-containing protein [Casimicrobiaceae bacterium]|nr:DUF3047 domain-containing protein [Casimicrobiaceae bacterium]